LTATQMSGIKKTIPYLTISPRSLNRISSCPESKGEPGHKKSKTFVEIFCEGFLLVNERRIKLNLTIFTGVAIISKI